MRRVLPVFLPGVIALSFPLFCGCAGAPGRTGSGSVKPHYDTAGPSSRELEQVNAFFSPQSPRKSYVKVAVMPFRAPVELAGAAIADSFTTELLQTYKYQIVERSQMEQALGDEAPGLKEVTDSALAMRVGQILGVQGVIIGAVPEYGMRAVGPKELPAIGMNIRMIDVVEGTVVWSVSYSGVSSVPTSLSSFAETLVRLCVARLMQEWVRVGDTAAANIPSPQVASYEGDLRGARIEVLPEPAFVSYRFYRSRSRDGFFQDVATLKGSAGQGVVFTDTGLLDLETYHYKISGVMKNGLTGQPAGPFEITTAGPPPMVEEFAAQSEIIREVPLTWIPLRDPHLKGYRIFRRRGTGKWTEVKTLNKPVASSHTDTRLDDGVTYEYRIIAFNKANVEGPPSKTTATTKWPPSPVSRLQAGSHQPRQVPLTWEPVLEAEVKDYVIYRAGGESGPWKEIAKVAGRESGDYLDRGTGGFWRSGATLKDRTEYFYKIRVRNVVDVESEDSPVVSAVTKPVPAAVAGLEAGQFEVKQVSLRWQRNPEPDIDHYEVFRGNKPGSEKTDLGDVPSSQTGFVDEGLKDGTNYHYKVRAVDSDGLIGRYSPSVPSETKPVPRKPKGVMAVDDGEQVIVTWHDNPERDITHYIIVKGGFLSTEELGRADKPPFVFSPERGKTVRFRIKAVDADGLESEASDEFRIKIGKKQ